MALEQLDDIAEEMADKLGIYGGDCTDSDGCSCRCCFTASFKARTRRAVELEIMMEKHLTHHIGVEGGSDVDT